MLAEEHSFDPEAPVIVIGGAGVDIVARLKSELVKGSPILGNIRISFGGVARNVAENLARLGQPVTLITVVGNDRFGEQLLEQTAAAGVDIHAVLRTSEQQTGTYLGIISAKGMLQFAVDDMQAISALTPEYIRSQKEIFQHASLVFLDASLPKATMRAVMSQARKARIPVCADPTSTTLAERLRPYLSSFYLITPNSAEASILCERPFEPSKRRQAIEAAKCLVSQGVEIAIIALAEFGVCYATSTTSGYIPAIRTEILDPTGAGDALTATVLFALINGIPLDDAIRLGVSAASLTLRHIGSVLPDLSLEKLYDHLLI